MANHFPTGWQSPKHSDRSLHHYTAMASALTAADIHAHYHMLVELVNSASVLPHNDPRAIDQIVNTLDSYREEFLQVYHLFLYMKSRCHPDCSTLSISIFFPRMRETLSTQILFSCLLISHKAIMMLRIPIIMVHHIPSHTSILVIEDAQRSS